MSVEIIEDRRETEIVSKQKKYTFHYVKPNGANNLKREGRKLRIRDNAGRRWFTFNGNQINSLKRILREAGELD
jgi:hypothetical protein